MGVLFLAAIEFSERLSYFGIATSLIIYLSKVMHQDLKTAAKSVNYWAGVTTLMPLFGGFLADAFLGRFTTVFVSSVIYLLGLILLTMSTFVPSLKACNAAACPEPRKVHEVVFFLAIYLISIGTGGHKPSLESFGADQFDENHEDERKKKMSYFNWWNFGLCSGLLLGVTVVVYIQDHVGWGAADIILTAVMALSLVIFIVGRPFYRYQVPTGSPFNPDAAGPGRLLCHTESLRFLDKAAIVKDREVGAEQQNPWRLATVTKVEEMKLLLNLIPIWLATLPFGISIAQTTTFFIKQGTMLNRNIGLQEMSGESKSSRELALECYFSVATMVVSALVERKRLSVVAKDPVKGSLSMSVFWLAPQFIIIGVGDAFTLVGLQEYFYDQVPDSMRSLGIAFYLSVIGASNFLSSLLITAVDHVAEKNGKSWFGKDLNSSRLDNFYWLLAGMTAANLFVYVLLARRYSYKTVQKSVAVADCYKDGLEGSMA
ncbi:hypothetical protein OIU78_003196 [Salix suchowensis]|nr:hypothetical protein OIU78_003196 [Salix suchowensis]